MQDHYTAIDYMMVFGLKRMDYMNDIWLQSVEDQTTLTSHVDLEATMEAVRGNVMRTKKSRL